MILHKVKSFTDPNKEYTIRQFENGVWKCSCPNFVVNERKIGKCKHILEVMKKVGSK